MSSDCLIRRRKGWTPTLARRSLPEVSTETGSIPTIASEREVCEVRNMDMVDITELSEQQAPTNNNSNIEDENENGTEEVNSLGDNIHQPTLEGIDAEVREIEPIDEEEEAEHEFEENQLMTEKTEEITEEIEATAEEIVPLAEESESEIEEVGQVIEQVEPGTEEIGDHNRKKGTAQIFKTLRMLRELDESGPDVDLGIKHHECLKMPNFIIFYGTNVNLFSDFEIQNTSEHSISYVVKAPNPHKFVISESLGKLLPFAKVTIKVQTNPDTVKKFDGIANEVLKVIGLPMKTPGSYLTLVSLEDYWTAYGTAAFPSVMAEEHDIKVFPENVEHFSMLGWVATMLKKCSVLLVQYFNPYDQMVEYVLDANRGFEFAQNKHIVCRYLKHLKKRENSTYQGKISFSGVLCVALLAIGTTWVYFIVASRTNLELPLANLDMICGHMNCTYYGIRFSPPQKTWSDFFSTIWSKITFGWWNFHQ